VLPAHRPGGSPGLIRADDHPNADRGRSDHPYGFGLKFDPILPGRAVVWHDGGGPGISSELACYPNLDVGVAVVSNADRASATVVAQAVAEFLIETIRRPSP